MWRCLLSNSLALLTLCTPLAAHQAPPPTDPPVAAAERPPWRWTTDERIAKRVHAADRAARRARALAQARVLAPGFTPIDGSVEPELFLPVELITRFALDTASPHERRRESYRAAIASRSWDVERFWDTLDTAAAPYLSLMSQSGTLQRQARGHADLTQLAPQICGASADLLNAAYAALGREAFDTFLYQDVAPSIKTYIADHLDTPDGLHRQSRGCR